MKLYSVDVVPTDSKFYEGKSAGIFYTKEKGLVDSDLIDDIYNRIKEKEINVDFEEYIIRMCSIINVYTFALSKDDVF